MHLSEHGKRLFHGAYTPPPKPCAKTLRQFLASVFTSHYDIKLEEASAQLRQSSHGLLSVLKRSPEQIPAYTNNAISNLVLTTLTKHDRVASKHEAQQTYNFLMALAAKASKEGDHNTAILLRSAMLSPGVDRLTTGKVPRIKKRKRHHDMLHRFDTTYGTFLNCHSAHLQSVLGRNYRDLPSAMVLHMHTKRTREHAKAFASIGTMPTKLLHVEQQLKEFIEQATDMSPSDIAGLYTMEPSHPCLGKGETISTQLHRLSTLVGKKSKC